MRGRKQAETEVCVCQSWNDGKKENAGQRQLIHIISNWVSKLSFGEDLRACSEFIINMEHFQ